ncbi:hypothetical protein GCM10009733_087200 [Nonomuraea maheshkhaliensis]|uniref:Uncharacterized protein n=1 Tax=Nonomuraea maheshkhaliensis TaxID=419590 RepID=A0ABP4SRM6_9ACTN
MDDTELIEDEDLPIEVSYGLRQIWTGAPDSGCHTLTVGEREYHASRSPFAQFDEVRTC